MLPKYKLARGPGGKCRVGHEFNITDDAATAINKIWDKLLGADPGLSREFFRNIEDDPISEIIKP